MGRALKAVVALIFAAILTPLGLRLVLAFSAVEPGSIPLEGLLIAWTDLLAAPFEALGADSLLEDALFGGRRGGPAGLPGGFPQLDTRILAALLGWTVVEGVVMAVIAVLRRR